MRKLLLLVGLLTACDSATEPQAPGAPPPAHAIVHNGTAYPQVDAQLARLYAFNNCLTGLGNYYLPSAKCPDADMTYEVATWSNEALANVFPQGFVVDASVSRQWLASWFQVIELGFQLDRVSCRARFALRAVGFQIDSLLLDVIAGQPLDFSGLPQPLTADIMDTAPFAGSGCPPETVRPAVAPAGGYSIFAINQTCNLADRSVEIIGDSTFAAQSVHSNSRLRVNGDENYMAGNATYVCGQNLSGMNWFDSGPTQVASRSAVALDTAFACTYSRNGNWNLDNNGPHWVGGTRNSRELRPGTYCGTGNISLGTNFVRGDVTFRASGTITISAAAPRLRSYENDVLFFSRSTSASAIRITGIWPSFAGHVYAPRGRINVAGADHASFNGSLIANRIRIQAVAVSIIGVGAPF